MIRVELLTVLLDWINNHGLSQDVDICLVHWTGGQQNQAENLFRASWVRMLG